MTNDLLAEVKDGIATLTLNRPEARNALSMEMRSALYDRLVEYERDDNVRCIIIRGAGEHFQAGGDVKSFSEMASLSPDERLKMFEKRIHTLTPTILTMLRMPKPIIASVRGGAAGFGLSLLLACDMVIASEDAFVTLAYIGIGTSPDGGGTFMLPRVVGMKKAMEIAMLGDRFDAETAKDLGLINFVVPTDDLESETAKLAKRLANGPTVAIGRTKQLLNHSLQHSLEEQLSLEAQGFAFCASSNDWAEGVTAFKEKRRPVYKGN
ncbi:MAG: enoyl-CoA hydratase [Sneathiella sp.]|jgi:2-(1,2-epoxy-1,2-dihydrophenyl)acetyl-CoA isomerase|uniref:enoyl-CoA hydratase/isomerase family protein n=1 Tax=Sneathiella sp. TaxID=1964365 RepID=UPI000C4BAD10|nr:enoyl-CoA hydratase [Sneathiella sp.]MAL78381.1 enoyl-CoA hydratase [Sneathiella sp.]|tara:strand:- start:237 stop:1034 length:798 start_codon:yes stop_codon:yes gene_type:complete